MAQRIVEVVIGRLITDDEFRTEFFADPKGTLSGLSERGLELTPIEVAALMATDPALWEHAAERVDPRLQKASLGAVDTARPSQKASIHHV